MAMKKKTLFVGAVLFAGGIVVTAVAFIFFLRSPLGLRSFGVHTVIDETGPNPLRVLFIGNSFTFGGKVPAQFVDIAKAQDSHQQMAVKQIAFPNYSLKQHWELGIAQELITQQKWEFVILQEQSAAAFIRAGDMKEYVEKYSKLVKSTGATPVLFETWADLDQQPKQSIITRAYHALAVMTESVYAPAGVSVALCLQSHPEIQLMTVDKHHMQDSGAFLVAATIYDAITGNAATVTPDKMPVSRVRLTDQEKSSMLEVAQQVELKRKNSWITIQRKQGPAGEVQMPD